ncbi:MAG TPA: DUF6065 family protein [Herpetosiphonaceae bacterium]
MSAYEDQADQPSEQRAVTERSAPDRQASTLMAYRLTPTDSMRLAPATAARAWMDNTADRFAHRCLPLRIANQHGWVILNSHAVRVTWTGDDHISGVRVEYLSGAAPYPIASHFGHGILTWHIPYMFRTPPGYNLLVRGPANSPKDGIYPLEGMVETDWAVATFTMNWKLTRPNHAVTFDVDEPMCMIVPQRRGELEAFRPEIHDIASAPAIHAGYRQWLGSREQFLAGLKLPTVRSAKDAWQKHYFQGTSPGGDHAPEHQVKLQLHPFDDGSGSASAEPGTMPVARSRRATAAASGAASAGADALRSRRDTMLTTPFEAADLDLINRVLQHYPEVVDLISTLKMLSKQTVYPIQTPDDFVAALGGPDATISFHGRSFSLAALRSAIPAYYFPIDSEDDLIAKLADVQARVRGGPPVQPDHADIQWGEQVDTPPDVPPPDELLHGIPRQPGVPGAVGLKKSE